MSMAPMKELGRLPAGWQWARLVDICEAGEDDAVQTGPFGAQLHSAEFTPSGVPVLNIGNVQWGYLDFGRLDHVTPEKAKLLSRYRVRSGDLLFTRSGTVGRCAVVPAEADGWLISYHLLRVRLDLQIAHPKFIEAAMRGSTEVLSQIRAHAGRGSTRDGVNTTILESILVPLPPLLEQRRIAAMLTEQMAAVDKARAAVQAQLEAARALTGAYLREAFPKPGEPLPEGWRWVRTRDVGDVQLGRQRSPKDHYGEHMRPYLRVANVLEDRIDVSNVLSMNFTPEEFKTYRLIYGDILLNEGQSANLVGRPAMYRDELPDGCFQNTLIRFRPSTAVLPEFALIVFRANLHSGRFAQIAKRTVNIAHLGAERLAGMEFPFAPLSEQHRIATALTERLASVRSLTATLERTLEAVDTFSAALLSQVLQGGH